MSDSSGRKEPLSYEKARKKRQGAYKRKQLISILAIVVLVFATLFINDFLVKKNVTSQIGDFVDSIGGSGYPIKLPGGVIKNTGALGKNLVVMNDTNLHVYNPKGKRILNVQQMSERSVMQTTEDRILVYHQGNRKVAVYGPTAELFSKEMDDSVIVGAIGAGGDIVLVTMAQQFMAEITVYNKNFERVMSRSSAAYQVSSVAISPKGSHIVVGYITTENGVLQSLVSIYEASTGEETHSFPLSEQLILDLSFQNENRFHVLTDRQHATYQLDGTEEGAFVLPIRTELKSVEQNKSQTLLHYQDNRTSGDEYALVGEKSQHLGTLTGIERVKDIALSGKYIYLLLPDGVQRYNFSMELLEFTELQGILSIERVRDSIFLFTKSDIQILGEE